MLTLNRKGQKVYYTSKVPDEILKLQKCLTISNPNAYHAKKFNAHVDDKIRFFDRKHQYFYHGLLQRVINHLNKEKIKFSLEGDVFEELDEIEYSKWLQPAERYYQRNAVEAALSKLFGIIKVPTRGGKTVITSEIIHQHWQRNPDLNVLFYVDGADLFKQTIRELAKFLEIPEKNIGRINGDRVN